MPGAAEFDVINVHITNDWTQQRYEISSWNNQSNTPQWKRCWSFCCYVINSSLLPRGRVCMIVCWGDLSYTRQDRSISRDVSFHVEASKHALTNLRRFFVTCQSRPGSQSSISSQTLLQSCFDAQSHVTCAKWRCNGCLSNWCKHENDQIIVCLAFWCTCGHLMVQRTILLYNAVVGFCGFVGAFWGSLVSLGFFKVLWGQWGSLGL